jgi:hypothetical protein
MMKRSKNLEALLPRRASLLFHDAFNLPNLMAS